VPSHGENVGSKHNTGHGSDHNDEPKKKRFGSSITASARAFIEGRVSDKDKKRLADSPVPKRPTNKEIIEQELKASGIKKEMKKRPAQSRIRRLFGLR